MLHPVSSFCFASFDALSGSKFTSRAVTVRSRPVWPPASKGAVDKCRGTCGAGKSVALKLATESRTLAARSGRR